MLTPWKESYDQPRQHIQKQKHYFANKGDQSWVFIGGTDVEAETPILWPPEAKSWLIGKDPDAGKDWGQEEKGTTEDEMVGWHHPHNGHGFGWTPGVGDGQGGLACCGSWGCKESDTTEWLNWTECIRVFCLFLFFVYFTTQNHAWHILELSKCSNERINRGAGPSLLGAAGYRCKKGVVVSFSKGNANIDKTQNGENRHPGHIVI